MEDIISRTKAETIRAKEKLAHALATTPDDRVNWSPSPTARTPVQHVGHIAMFFDVFSGVLEGKQFPFSTTTEADRALREAEQQFTSRRQVQDLLDKNCTAFLIWLDALAPERFNTTVKNQFITLPMAVALTIPAEHALYHAAQIEYIQTIYGDRDWHWD